MTSDRAYRRALSRGKAIKEIKKDAGTKYDPELVEVFLNIVNDK